MNTTHYLKIEHIIEQQLLASQRKTTAKLPRIILLGMIAGFFVAVGAEASNLASHGIADPGLAKVMAGTVFPIGLMLIIFLTGELFTSDCLISMAVYSKKIPWLLYLRHLVLIYVSNFTGACLMAWMINHSGQLNYNSGAVGAYTIKMAAGKVAVDPAQAFISAILCNILVCLAIFMAAAATDIAGKCLAVFFPIFVFVISGFEHCIANMYYIPAGIFAAANPDYVEKAAELYHISAGQLTALSWGGMIHNLIPVTLGNMTGGMVFVGLSFWYLHGAGQAAGPLR